MGKQNDVLLDYFDDNNRFADFFNGILFQGRPEVRAEELEEASERYTQREKNGRRQIGAKKGEIEYRSRFRDLKKRMKDGGTLRILAMEAQELVDYSMPLRCMNYDVQEYLRQLRWLQNRNEQEKIYETPAEKLCRLKKGDRLSPVYTICLYHGMKEWDGPLSLRSMMDFGGHKGRFDVYFKDYAFHLVEANRPMNYGNFHTSLREVLEILPYRNDKEKMRKLINERKEYRTLDRETMEVIAVMTNNRKLMEDVEAYRTGEEKYDMCEALKGIQEEGIAIGRELGLEQGLEQGILGMAELFRELGLSDDWMIEKLREKFSMTREEAEQVLAGTKKG